MLLNIVIMLCVITPGFIYFLTTFDYLFPFSAAPVPWKVGFLFFFPGFFLGPFCFSLPERAAKDITLPGVFCGTLVPLGRAGRLVVFYTPLPTRAWVTELACLALRAWQRYVTFLSLALLSL